MGFQLWKRVFKFSSARESVGSFWIFQFGHGRMFWGFRLIRIQVFNLSFRRRGGVFDFWHFGVGPMHLLIFQFSFSMLLLQVFSA